MAEYRIQNLNTDGSVSSASAARCLDDQEALELAQRLAPAGGTSEVWMGTRLVGRVTQTTAADIVQQGRRWMRG